MLMVSENGEEVGWCQWYLWANYPGESQARAVHEGEIGIDYAIGDPAHVGRGLGTRLVAALVEQARSAHPGAGVLVDPEESNVASRRVLEKNGFVLIDVRVIASEEGNPRRALYRHSATPRTS
jgi:aminoglycoside 6'-N-acetyltransferase